MAEQTWLLSINVTDHNLDKTLRVSGDHQIGAVMLKLVESMGKWNHIDEIGIHVDSLVVEHRARNSELLDSAQGLHGRLFIMGCSLQSQLLLLQQAKA